MKKREKSTWLPHHQKDVKQNKKYPTALHITAFSPKSVSALPTCRPPWAPGSENEPHLPLWVEATATRQISVFICSSYKKGLHTEVF